MISLKEIKEFLNSDSVVTKNALDKLREITTKEKNIVEIKKLMYELKEVEMTRLFKEYLYYEYERRFNIDKKTLIAALVGNEDEVLKIMNDQAYRERDYFEKLNMTKTYNILSDLNPSLSRKSKK